MKSQSSFKSNGIFTINIKEQLYKDFSEYIKTIKTPYKAFTNNHHKVKKKGGAVTLSLFEKPVSTLGLQRINSVVSELSTSSGGNQYNIPTESNKYDSQINSIIKIIGNNYFEERFKIEDTYLNLKFMEIQNSITGLMEKSGVCEKEISKILVHSNMIYHYILDHKYIYNDIYEVLDTICFTKVKFAKIKHSYIDNAMMLIRAKRRKQKIAIMLKKAEPIKQLYELTKKINNLDVEEINSYHKQLEEIKKQDEELKNLIVFQKVFQKIEEMKAGINKKFIEKIVSLVQVDFEREFWYINEDDQDNTSSKLELNQDILNKLNEVVSFY